MSSELCSRRPRWSGIPGQRLGDKITHTQVVEGFGAKDFVAAVQEWWRDFVGHLMEGLDDRGAFR
jgi:hypothetical protein